MLRKNKMEERLLKNWLKISYIIRNNRIINELPYSEIVIISILKYHQSQMSFKDLTTTSKILKSQLNRSINSLEKKQLITKNISQTDKRSKIINLTKKGEEAYESFHPIAVESSKKMIEILGEEKAKELIDIFEIIIKEYK